MREALTLKTGNVPCSSATTVCAPAAAPTTAAAQPGSRPAVQVIVIERPEQNSPTGQNRSVVRMCRRLSQGLTRRRGQATRPAVGQTSCARPVFATSRCRGRATCPELHFKDRRALADGGPAWRCRSKRTPCATCAAGLRHAGPSCCAGWRACCEHEHAVTILGMRVHEVLVHAGVVQRVELQLRAIGSALMLAWGGAGACGRGA
jgi:hypothetical protein